MYSSHAPLAVSRSDRAKPQAACLFIDLTVWFNLGDLTQQYGRIAACRQRETQSQTARLPFGAQIIDIDQIVPPRALHQLAEARERCRRQCESSQRFYLPLGSVPGGRERLAPKDRARHHGLPRLESRLFPWHIFGDEHSPRRQLCHHVAAEHRAEQAVVQSCSKIMIEQT